jgi:hypothetical protein
MAGPDLDKLDHRQQGNGRQGSGRQGEGEPGGHGLHPAAAVAALGDVYGGVTEMLGALSEPDFLLPTRCLGWIVTDCLYHLLGDARRALTALATPATTGPDVDFVTYWKPWQPGGDGSLTRARAFRAAAATVTAVSGPAMLVEAWRETAPAAVRLAHLAPYPVVATQGHALNVADFAATLAIEATVHHLDMIAELPGARPPAPSGLALVRRALDGLLGQPAASTWDDAALAWDDTTYALKGTGRIPLTDPERAALGPLAGRFPLFG